MEDYEVFSVEELQALLEASPEEMEELLTSHFETYDEMLNNCMKARSDV